MSIKPVSDLYLITYEDGSSYKSTRDAKEAVDAIGAGFKVEEFVSLENHRAAMLQASPVCTCPSGDGSLRWPCPVHPGNSPAQSDCCPAQNHVSPEQNGDTPAQSQGWIQVSERMPDREVDVQVYCPDKKEQMVAYLERNELEGYFRFATWRTGEGIYCQPTHWMPLPAAPQEVNRE